MFFSQTYHKFDDNGVPTHSFEEKTDAEGKKEIKEKELSKELRNKLQKEFNKQEKTYKKWLDEEEKKKAKEDGMKEEGGEKESA